MYIQTDEILKALEDLRKKAQTERKKNLKSEKKIEEFIKKMCDEIKTSENFNGRLKNLNVLGGLSD